MQVSGSLVPGNSSSALTDRMQPLVQAVQALAQDERVKERGQAVLAVCPGWCRTGLGSDKVFSCPLKILIVYPGLHLQAWISETALH